jgi:hypothetical protein
VKYRELRFAVGSVKNDANGKKVFCELANCTVTCPATDTQGTLDLIDEVEDQKAIWDQCWCDWIELNKDATSIDELKPPKFKAYWQSCGLPDALPQKPPEE